MWKHVFSLCSTETKSNKKKKSSIVFQAARYYKPTEYYSLWQVTFMVDIVYGEKRYCNHKEENQTNESFSIYSRYSKRHVITVRLPFSRLVQSLTMFSTALDSAHYLHNMEDRISETINNLQKRLLKADFTEVFRNSDLNGIWITSNSFSRYFRDMGINIRYQRLYFTYNNNYRLWKIWNDTSMTLICIFTTRCNAMHISHYIASTHWDCYSLEMFWRISLQTKVSNIGLCGT